MTALYTLARVGLQGVVSPARLQANAGTAVVYVAAALGGTGWARLMALAIALSVIAATGTGIVLWASRSCQDATVAIKRQGRCPGAA